VLNTVQGMKSETNTNGTHLSSPPSPGGIDTFQILQ
jgi:hypothetical protein